MGKRLFNSMSSIKRLTKPSYHRQKAAVGTAQKTRCSIWRRYRTGQWKVLGKHIIGEIVVKGKILILGMGCLMLLACYGETDDREILDPVDPVIESFINSYGFPKLQETKIILRIPEKGVTVFTVKYGNPNDCIAGCFFSDGEGILNGEKIGWISINNYEDIEIPDDYTYDLDSSDEYLFTDDFYTALTAAHGWVGHGSYMNLMAADKDTPYEILLGYAEMIAKQRGWGYLSNVLLGNPVVKTDENILMILASLPPEYTEYADVIAEAKIYLEEL